MKKYVLILAFILLTHSAICLDLIHITPKNPEITPFYIADTPITQSLYQQIVGSNPSFFKADSLPVERVSWYDAIVFCNLLSVAHGLEPVYIHYRPGEGLPLKNVRLWMEAWGGQPPTHRVASWSNIHIDPIANGYRLLHRNEWDYLYSNLTNEIFENIEDYAWIYTNSENRTHTVATKNQDPNMLYDFLGNIYEWKFEDGGNISERFFRYNNEEQEFFYSNLAFKKFAYREFITLQDDRGFYRVTRNSMIGLRVARQE